MKDWTGNKKSAFTTIGAAGHANHARQSEDYYATEPKATELLCELEHFSHDVWEPACGWLSTYPWYNAVLEEFIKNMEE